MQKNLNSNGWFRRTLIGGQIGHALFRPKTVLTLKPRTLNASTRIFANIIKSHGLRKSKRAF